MSMTSLIFFQLGLSICQYINPVLIFQSNIPVTPVNHREIQSVMQFSYLFTKEFISKAP